MKYFRIKNTRISVTQGDISALAVDAVVCPAGCNLKMEAGSAVLLKLSGGAVIEEEAAEKGPVEPGRAVFTNAGQLKANYVIHAVAVDGKGFTGEGILRGACAGALMCARGIRCGSVAFPGLGCGVPFSGPGAGATGAGAVPDSSADGSGTDSAALFPAAGAAKILSQEIIKFLKFNDTELTEIVICLPDEETFNAYRRTVFGYLTHLKDNLGNGPYVTVDIIIELDEGIVLIERSNPPYGWALPGGFVDCGESVETAAAREAKEETNMSLVEPRQFRTYSNPDRDPRFHTVSTVFVAKGQGRPRFGDDAKGLKVVPYDRLLQLEYAFDHKEIIRDYLNDRERHRP